MRRASKALLARRACYERKELKWTSPEISRQALQIMIMYYWGHVVQCEQL